ncbi:MAG: hypothetical protein M0P94_02900 [Candidatus Absconditabacterales bacterium]|nr:hypothetical protein [Candidatus Absconditabacterales bacterium]
MKKLFLFVFFITCFLFISCEKEEIEDNNPTYLTIHEGFCGNNYYWLEPGAIAYINADTDWRKKPIKWFVVSNETKTYVDKFSMGTDKLNDTIIVSSNNKILVYISGYMEVLPKKKK